MNDTPETPIDSEETAAAEFIPHWRFTLIMAEVIFDCDLGIQTRRIQFVSKSDGSTFPRTRLLQLQTLAASNVAAELKAQSNGALVVKSVEAVYLLGTIDLGWMTEDEFLHSETTLVSPNETQKEDNPPQPNSDNVVPFRPATDPSA